MIREAYEAVVKINSHVRNPKPTFDDYEKLLAQYRYNGMTKVEKINHNLKKELGVK